MSSAQTVDYSVVSVPEESGCEFMKITRASDYVCMPSVVRHSRGIDWYSNRILAVAPKGNDIAYLSSRNGSTNVFIKDLDRQGGAVQRTNRSNVLDFSFSPDGQYLCFSESRGRSNSIFQMPAYDGYVCRQITSGDQDYSPVYSADMKLLFFARTENRGVSIWSYDIQRNFLSNYTTGMNPCMLGREPVFLVSRLNTDGFGEIWKINYTTGVEECIVSEPGHSFTSPSVSPDGQWVVFVGDGHIPVGNGEYVNTDLFVSRVDGTGFRQLTYHAADDLSPVWSRDGNYIYFISQRGDAGAVANVWRMNFTR